MTITFKSVQGEGHLVLGMDWFPIIGTDARRVAMKQLAQLRPSHWIMMGADVSAVGMATLMASPQRGRHFYSAAVLAAQRYPRGTVLLVLPLPQDGWWMLAVHEGVVVARTDRVCATEEEVSQACRTLEASYSQLQRIDAAPTLFEELLGEVGGATGRLHRRRARRGRQALIVCTLLIMTLVAYRLFLRPINAPEIPSRNVAEDARQQWDQALQQERSLRLVHGPVGTQGMLHLFDDVPVGLAGWALQKVECHARDRDWDCQARFVRKARDASNDGFLSMAPSSWSHHFDPLDVALPRWQSQAAVTTFAERPLRDIANRDATPFSAWQHLREAFSRIAIGRREAIMVPPPRDQEGRPLPRPLHFPSDYTRTVLIEGPLRSISVLLPHTDSMFWQKAILTLDENAMPSLNRSRLQLALQGVLYETDAIVAPLAVPTPQAASSGPGGSHRARLHGVDTNQPGGGAAG